MYIRLLCLCAYVALVRPGETRQDDQKCITFAHNLDYKFFDFVQLPAIANSEANSRQYAARGTRHSIQQ